MHTFPDKKISHVLLITSGQVAIEDNFLQKLVCAFLVVLFCLLQIDAKRQLFVQTCTHTRSLFWQNGLQLHRTHKGHQLILLLSLSQVPTTHSQEMDRGTNVPKSGNETFSDSATFRCSLMGECDTDLEFCLSMGSIVAIKV